MNVRIVVPYRDDRAHRARLWEYCRAWWAREFPGWPIVEAEPPPGPWCSAAAINQAAAGRWDVAVIIDADSIPDADNVRAAVQLAAETGRLALPFDRRLMLNPAGTRAVLDDGQMLGSQVKRAEADRNADFASSCVAIGRRLWDAIGGEDERFKGWGGHDDGLHYSAKVIGGGVDRIPGTIWHLWHPWDPTRDGQSPGYRQTRLLARRYLTTTDPAAMRRFLAEPRTPDQTVAVCLTNGARPKLLADTLASAAENLTGPVGRRVLVIDAGHPNVARPTLPAVRTSRQLGETAGWDVVPVKAGGYTRAVTAAFDVAIGSGQPWIWWLEDDWTFNEPVDLPAMQAAMLENPRLVQMSLGRQPVYREEVAAGGFIEAWSKTGHRFTERTCSTGRYVEHAAHWTQNPMLTTRAFLAAHPWPTGAGSERRFSDNLFGSDPWPVCGIWGKIDDPPRVTHTGTVRAGPTRGY